MSNICPEWEVVPFRNVVRQVIDFRGRTPLKIGMDWGNGEILSLSANNVRQGHIDVTKDAHLGSEELYAKWMTKGACEKGDIVFTMEAPLGNVAQIPDNKKYILSQRVILLKINTSIAFNTFIAYLMRSENFQQKLIQCSTGSTVTGVQQQKLNKFEMLLPTIQQQKKIANILSTVDKLIENTQALIDKYTAIKQGMMADLFTRGIDLSPGSDGTPASNPNYGQLRPSVEDAPELYKQTDLGWIPKEWDVLPLQQLAQKIQDGTHFSPVVGGEGYLYLTSKNIRFGYLTLKNIETISMDQHESIYKRCDVKKGDLLLTKDGANTGNAAINDIEEPFSMLSSVAFIRSNELSNEEYLLHYILSDFAQSRIKDAMSGNAITRLTLEKINNFEVPVPAGKEQRVITDKLNALKDFVDDEKKYLNKLKEQKKGLMQDLLTGKVTVLPLGVPA